MYVPYSLPAFFQPKTSKNVSYFIRWSVYVFQTRSGDFLCTTSSKRFWKETFLQSKIFLSSCVITTCVRRRNPPSDCFCGICYPAVTAGYGLFFCLFIVVYFFVVCFNSSVVVLRSFLSRSCFTLRRCILVHFLADFHKLLRKFFACRLNRRIIRTL